MRGISFVVNRRRTVQAQWEKVSYIKYGPSCMLTVEKIWAHQIKEPFRLPECYCDTVNVFHVAAPMTRGFIPFIEQRDKPSLGNIGEQPKPSFQDV